MEQCRCRQHAGGGGGCLDDEERPRNPMQGTEIKQLRGLAVNIKKERRANR